MSRQHPSDPKTHQILGIQQVKPAELAQQMMLDVGNAWGVLHAIIDTCLEQDEGKYLILKDPNQVLHCNLNDSCWYNVFLFSRSSSSFLPLCLPLLLSSPLSSLLLPSPLGFCSLWCVSTLFLPRHLTVTRKVSVMRAKIHLMKRTGANSWQSIQNNIIIK